MSGEKAEWSPELKGGVGGTVGILASGFLSPIIESLVDPEHWVHLYRNHIAVGSSTFVLGVAGTYFAFKKFRRADASQQESDVLPVPKPPTPRRGKVTPRDPGDGDAPFSVAVSLHRHWFPGYGDEGLDHEYRVSLWSRSRVLDRTVWSCAARSIMGACARTWPHADPEHPWPAGLGYIGLTGATAPSSPVPLDGLPLQERTPPSALEDYRRRAHLTPQQHKDASWPYASIAAQPGMWKDRPVVIVAVERRTGKAIQPRTTPKAFAKETALVANLLAKAMSPWQTPS